MSNSFSCEYLTAAQIRQRFGSVSRMWLHRRMHDAGFPPPVNFGGRLRYWPLSAVEDWEAKMIERGVSNAKSQTKSGD